MISYHPRAKTNIHLRRLINSSPESSRVLAVRLHLNSKTILKWRRRGDLTDRPCGAGIHHYRLTPLQQRIIAKVRKHLKLNLDDLVVALKPYVPDLNRDNCYRTLVKHRLNRLPDPFKDKSRGRFGFYLPGFLHIDLAYLPVLPGFQQRRYFLVAIDRITKLVFLMLVNGKTQLEAIRFLKTANRFYPCRIHRILTDNGKEFARKFTQACVAFGIKHKKTKIKHPWTNGQAEITVKLVKKDTIWQRFYRDYREIEADFRRWQIDYNLNRRLKSLKGLTPYRKTLEYYQSLTEEKRLSRFRKHPKILLNSAPLHGAT